MKIRSLVFFQGLVQDDSKICISDLNTVSFVIFFNNTTHSFDGYVLTVFQGLIRTCSHPPVIETEQTEPDITAEPEASIRKISYKDYLELWSGLLESAKIKVNIHIQWW